MAKSKKKKNEFLVKIDFDKFVVVSENELKDLPFQKIYNLAIINYLEQKNLLMLDATQGDHYINEFKVTEELEKTLTKFEELYPSLRQQLNHSTHLKNNFVKC